MRALWVNGEISLVFFELMASNPVYKEMILNSFRLGMFTTIATTLLSLPIAFLLVRYDFKGKERPQRSDPGAHGPPAVRGRHRDETDVRPLRIHQPSSSGVGNRRPTDRLFGGGFTGVVILQVLHLYPIMFLNVAAALSNIDPSLEEAARNMGARGFRLFRSVTFPLMLPGYFAGAIIVFIWAFTDLGTPLIFNYRQVVMVEIFNAISDINENPMAYALVVFLLLLTVLFFYLSKLMLGKRAGTKRSRGDTSDPLPAGRRQG